MTFFTQEKGHFAPEKRALGKTGGGGGVSFESQCGGNHSQIEFLNGSTVLVQILIFIFHTAILQFM
jgi:hypothetical protein